MVNAQRIQPDTSQYLINALKPIENKLFNQKDNLERKRKISGRKLIVDDTQKKEESIWKTWARILDQTSTEKELLSLKSELEKILKNKPSLNLQKLLLPILNKTELKISLLRQNKIQIKAATQASSTVEIHQEFVMDRIVGIDNIKAELIPLFNKALEELERCNYQLHNVSEIIFSVPVLNKRYPRIEIIFKNNSYAAVVTTSTAKRLTINSLAALPKNNDYIWLLQVVILCHLADLTRKLMEIINEKEKTLQTSRKTQSKKPSSKRFRKGIIVRHQYQNLQDKPHKENLSQAEGILVTGYVRRLPEGQKRSLKQSMFYAALTGSDPLILDQYSDGKKRTFVPEYYRHQNIDKISFIELICLL